MTFQTTQTWHRSNSILGVAVAVLAIGIGIAEDMLDGTMQYVVVGLAVVAVLFCVALIGRNARDAR